MLTLNSGITQVFYYKLFEERSRDYSSVNTFICPVRGLVNVSQESSHMSFEEVVFMRILKFFLQVFVSINNFYSNQRTDLLRLFGDLLKDSNVKVRYITKTISFNPMYVTYTPVNFK